MSGKYKYLDYINEGEHETRLQQTKIAFPIRWVNYMVVVVPTRNYYTNASHTQWVFDTKTLIYQGNVLGGSVIVCIVKYLHIGRLC